MAPGRQPSHEGYAVVLAMVHVATSMGDSYANIVLVI